MRSIAIIYAARNADDCADNLLDAKTSLSQPMLALENGEPGEFVIARNCQPAARLVPLEKALSDRSRRVGIAKDRFKVPADLDRLNAEVLNLFEGG